MSEIRRVPMWVWVAVGIVVVGVIYLRMRASATAGATAQGQAQPLTTAGGTSTDSLGVIAQELQTLQQQIAQGATNPNAPAIGPIAPIVGDLTGSGYGPPPGSTIIDTPTGNYQYLGTWAQVQDFINNGQPLFTQPTPGVFIPWGGTASAAPGTPLFSQTPFASSAVQAHA